VVFLPHIYESNKKERDAYIQTMKDAATEYKGRPLSYMWA